METGLSKEAFGNLLFICAIIGIIVVFVICYIAHKKGIDITSIKFQMKVLFGVGLIFGIFPLMLSNLSLKHKVIGSSLAFIGGLINYLGVGRLQQIFKKRLLK